MLKDEDLFFPRLQPIYHSAGAVPRVRR